jgi:hypothetical protein
MKIETKLLKITAESRLRIMKHIWSHASERTGDIAYRSLITNELTHLRKEIFETVISDEYVSDLPIIREIAEDDRIPQMRKNIDILALCGMDSECIAALNCVNIGYVRMCIRTLKADYPELFG